MPTFMLHQLNLICCSGWKGESTRCTLPTPSSTTQCKFFQKPSTISPAWRWPSCLMQNTACWYKAQLNYAKYRSWMQLRCKILDANHCRTCSFSLLIATLCQRRGWGAGEALQVWPHTDHSHSWFRWQDGNRVRQYLSEVKPDAQRTKEKVN